MSPDLDVSENTMAPHSSTLAWRIPWTEEPGMLQSMGSLRVGHDWVTSLSLFTYHAVEKEMATHSSVLAWRIPGTEEPGGLPSMGFAQSRTQLMWLSSSSSRFRCLVCEFMGKIKILELWDLGVEKRTKEADLKSGMAMMTAGKS